MLTQLNVAVLEIFVMHLYSAQYGKLLSMPSTVFIVASQRSSEEMFCTTIA